jgi:hypothetical protein
MSFITAARANGSARMRTSHLRRSHSDITGRRSCNGDPGLSGAMALPNITSHHVSALCHSLRIVYIFQNAFDILSAFGHMNYLSQHLCNLPPRFSLRFLLPDSLPFPQIKISPQRPSPRSLLPNSLPVTQALPLSLTQYTRNLPPHRSLPPPQNRVNMPPRPPVQQYSSMPDPNGTPLLLTKLLV